MIRMDKNLFYKNGHIKNWVFFPPSWGGEDYWFENFSNSEKELLTNHMKSCNHCREKEIEATLRWAELRPRATRKNLIESSSCSKKLDGTDSVIQFEEYPNYIREHILQYIKGQLIVLSRDEDGKLKK